MSESVCHPLALDTWSPVFAAGTRSVVDSNGRVRIERPMQSSFVRAMEVANDQCETIPCEVERELARRALLASIADQASRNNRHDILSNFSTQEREQYRQQILGEAEPQEMVRFLIENPNFEAAEVARLTHFDRWDVRREIDEPVRESLLESEALDTHYLADPAYFKIKMFDEDGLIIERKRPVLITTLSSKIGEAAITVVRNMFMINYHDSAMPSDILEYGQAEHKKEQDRESPDYDFTKESMILTDAFNSVVQDKALHHKPTYLKPLMTTYYAATAGSRAPVIVGARAASELHQ